MSHPSFKFYISVSAECVLTEILESDRPQFIEYLNEKEISKQTFAIPYPYGEKEADQYLALQREKASTEKQRTSFAIRTAEDHHLIGVFGFHGYEPGGHKVEIGYWLAKPNWGRGIMTDVVRVCCQYAFDELGVVRIFAKSFSRNIGSIRVLQKTGFQQEGILRKDSFKEGELLDVTLFAKLKDSINR